MGCQIVLVPCNPCLLYGQLFAYDCPIQSITCPIYPWQDSPQVNSFGNVLSVALTQFLDSNGLTTDVCDLNGLQTTWFVNVEYNGANIISYPFFNGVGYNNTLSVPSGSTWLDAVTNSFSALQVYGLSYIFNDNETFTIYNNNCIPLSVSQTFKLNVGINFNLFCN